MNPNEFEIRDYQKGDISGIDQLWMATGLGNALRGDNDEVIERTIQAGGRFLVLVYKPTCKIMGTSWVTSDHRRLYWHHFGISPESQGKGLGKYLALETMKWAKTIGLQIKLEVHTQNKNAVKMYKKLEFSYLGDYDVYIIRDWSKINL